MSIIKTLNSLTTLTPDEIVSKISKPVVFDRRTFNPWVVPVEYRGRQVLIERAREDGLPSSWWFASGQGSGDDRSKATPWDIEDAFRRFDGDYASMINPWVVPIILHLI